MRNKRNEPNRLIPAEVLPELKYRYNGRVMHIAKRAYSPLVVILGLGLMYSQVCNVICAFSNCSGAVTIRRAEAVEHGAHCHQKGSAPQKKQSPEGQHKCPAHGAAVSVLPSETISTVVSHDAWQTAAELVPSFNILFDLAGNGSDRGGRFRAPPRRSLLTILRI
ncbi:MAG TPA: hypothetical protein VFY40_12630 [Blastocatellia bacterium]|nr:hypothetical protein [Blastocatellia bacterium]